MDYVFFIYGLAFILLASTANAMTRVNDVRLPWRWLALFGLGHGLYEWLEMLALDMGDLPLFALARVLLMAFSFLLLMEFARRGAATLNGGRRIPVMALVPFACLAGLGQVWGLEGFGATVRYALAFTGSVWAAWVFGAVAGKAVLPGSRWRMRGAAAAMVVYAITAGLVVPPATFFPATFLNTTKFEEVFGFPLPAVRCAAIILLAFCVWRQYRAWRRVVVLPGGGGWRAGYEWGTAVVMAAVLALGWWATEKASIHADLRERETLIHAAQSAAAALDPALVVGLAGDRGDIDTPSYRLLHRACRKVSEAVASTRYTYILGFRNGTVFFHVDTEPYRHPEPSAAQVALPGEPYAGAPAEVTAVFENGVALTAGPYSDKWGRFLSAFAPIMDGASRSVVGVLGLDVEAASWARELRLARTGPIFITALLSCLMLVSFTVWRQMLDNAALQAADVDRSRRQEAALYAVATLPAVASGDLSGAARSIVDKVAEAIDVARISLWLVTPDSAALRCLALLEQNPRRFSEGATLSLSDYPKYFAALAEGRAIDAPDAVTDPRTREFADGYLRPLGIVSMLDAPVRVGGRVVGVVCLEHKGPLRVWLPGEIRFVGEVADQVAQALSNADRLQAQRELRKANDQLEARVAERTAEVVRTLGELRSAEERYRTLVAQIPGVVYRCEAAAPHRLWFISAGVEPLTGYAPSAFMGAAPQRQWADLVAPESVAALERTIGEAVREQRPYEMEYAIRHADGSTRWVSERGQPCFVGTGAPAWLDGVMVDITEKRQSEESRRVLELRMQQAQKLESLGVMAGGIAHDFNNILMAILGNVDLALLDAAEDSPLRANLSEIERACHRASDLCRQMMAYSGKGRVSVAPLCLNATILEMRNMVEVALSKKVTLRINTAERLPAIDADGPQIRQVIMNLVLNAAESLGDRCGMVTLSTGSLYCTRAMLDAMWQHESRPEGDYVYVEVADTGCGMDRETQIRMFDPFFTTKFAGRGLGLPAVLGIVRGHRGAIGVQSAPWQGTTVRVFFPVAAAGTPVAASSAKTQPATAPQAKKEPDPKAETRAAPVSFRGQGLVLVVDDEESVREAAGRQLQHLGFEVVTAADGREALCLYQVHREALRAVMLDVAMPVMDGRETLRELRQLDDRLPVVVCSGYAEQDVGNRIDTDRVTAFLAKPYTLAHLTAVLQSVLGS